MPGLAAPCESVHELMPGPPGPSKHWNDVTTDCPCVKLAPVVGEMIEAEGAAALTVSVELPKLGACELSVEYVPVRICEPWALGV